jgi:GDP-L-fucose synthase
LINNKLHAHSKIYLAGHRGMVGAAIHRRLNAQGFSNVLTVSHEEVDLTDQAAVKLFFEATKPDYVILAAARVGGI